MKVADHLGACGGSRNSHERRPDGGRRFDALVTPTVAQPALELGSSPLAARHRARWRVAEPGESFTALWNIAGQPAVSLPLDVTPEGPPVGVQVRRALRA
jgi:amidase